MLLEITKLNIKTNGHKRQISLEKIYINANNIVSISDYSGANPFLKEESSHLSGEAFSLVRVSNGPHCEDLIVQGTAENINNRIIANTKKGLIHG